MWNFRLSECLVKFIDPFRDTHNTEKMIFFHQLMSSKILNVIIIKLLKTPFIVEFEVSLPCNSFFIRFWKNNLWSLKCRFYWRVDFNITDTVLTFSRDIIDLVIHCLYIEILMKSDIFGREKGRVIFSEIKILSLFKCLKLKVPNK